MSILLADQLMPLRGRRIRRRRSFSVESRINEAGWDLKRERFVRYNHAVDSSPAPFDSSAVSPSDYEGVTNSSNFKRLASTAQEVLSHRIRSPPKLFDSRVEEAYKNSNERFVIASSNVHSRIPGNTLDSSCELRAKVPNRVKQLKRSSLVVGRQGTAERNIIVDSSMSFMSSNLAKNLKFDALPEESGQSQNLWADYSDADVSYDDRYTRLAWCQLFILIFFLMSVLGGLILHKPKVYGLKPSLSVDMAIINSYQAMKQQSQVTPYPRTLGNAIALDLLLQLPNGPTYIFESPKVKRSSADHQSNSDLDMKPPPEPLQLVQTPSEETAITIYQPSGAPLTCPASSYTLFQSHQSDGLLPTEVVHNNQIDIPLRSLQMAVSAVAKYHPKLRVLVQDTNKNLFCPVPSASHYLRVLAGEDLVNFCSKEEGFLSGHTGDDKTKMFEESGVVKIFSVGKRAPAGLMDEAVVFFGINNSFFHEAGLGDVLEEQGQGAEVIPMPLQVAMQNLLKMNMSWDTHKTRFRFAARSSLISDAALPNRSLMGIRSKEPLVISNMTVNAGSNDESRREVDCLINLFKATGGLLSPNYLLSSFLQQWLCSSLAYVLVFILWLHSFFSPHPLTLVHIPRLCFLHVPIIVYRRSILYFCAGTLERNLGGSTDFSDTIVHYLSLILIMSIEFISADRSHQKKNVNQQDAARPLIDDSDERKHKRRFHFKEFLLDTPSVLWFVYIYTCTLVLALSYSAFFTALFFHSPHEIIGGVLVALFGIYFPFWLLVLSGCISLNRLGILRYRRFLSFRNRSTPE